MKSYQQNLQHSSSYLHPDVLNLILPFRQHYQITYQHLYKFLVKKLQARKLGSIHYLPGKYWNESSGITSHHLKNYHFMKCRVITYFNRKANT